MADEKINMFYGASALIFQRAKELRDNQTSAEALLWNRLSKSQFYGFRFKRQQPISGFIADFYCHASKLVIEVDGDVHNLESQKEYDINRTIELENLGLTVIRFTNTDIVNNLESVLDKIKEYLPIQPI